MTRPEIDAVAVARYWEQAGATRHSTGASGASYMAHEQGIPYDCVQHRARIERDVLGGILADRPRAEDAAADRLLLGTVLDLGCGAGEWTSYFSGRARRVIGVEQSHTMFGAARERTRGLANVELVRSSATEYVIEEPVDVAFLGGLLMYLERASAVRLLAAIAERLEDGGLIIARESTLERGEVSARVGYDVAYRSIAQYARMTREAGLELGAVIENDGYRHMEMVVQLVELARTIPLVGRACAPATLAKHLWATLKRSGTFGLDHVPRVSRHLPWPLPKLSNHFFVLRVPRRPRGP